MAITLAAGINATQNRVTLTEPLTAKPGDLFRLGDEVVEFGGYGRTTASGRLVDHSLKVVSFGRGASGTTPASHSADTPVLRVADGLVSSVSAPDPFGAPASVFYDADDPGAVGAGAIWIKPTDGVQELYIRREADDGWLAASLSIESAEGFRARVRLNAEASSAVVAMIALDDGEVERVRAVVDSSSNEPFFSAIIRDALDSQVATLNITEADGSLTINPDTGSIGLSFDLTSLYLSTPASGVSIWNNETEGEVSINTGPDDPSAGAGIAAFPGSLYLRTNGEHWAKTGALDTEWTQMAVVA